MQEGLTAHDAGDDAMMTAKVIESLARGTSARDIQRMTEPGRVDLTGKFRRNDEGEILIDFGRLRHRPARLEPKQLQWMLERAFAPSAKAIARQILETHHYTIDTIRKGERAGAAASPTNVGPLPDHMFTPMLRHALPAQSQFGEPVGEIFRAMGSGGRAGFDRRGPWCTEAMW